MKHAAGLAFLVFCVDAIADSAPYISADGHQYTATQNKDGAVLVSKNPVSRFLGHGAATRIVTDIETLYLGKTCDAFSKVLGRGKWAWANGGFIIEFPDYTLKFPRQEIDANHDLGCQM